MSITINESLAARLASEQTIWLTTVRADGTPQPTPVWFLWNGETFLIFTQPASQKLRNLAGNSTVALNFNTDAYGGSVVVFTGDGYVDPQPVGSAETENYLQKYAAGIKMLGWTQEQMIGIFSTVLRVRPSKVRVME
jgi:PPOX class probable F420-dependent enzyme